MLAQDADPYPARSAKHKIDQSLEVFPMELFNCLGQMPREDLTIITYGRQVNDAVAIANKVEADGISVEVVDLRTVSPLDMDTVLTSVAKTGRAIVLHEAVKKFGPGAEIASQINEELFGKLKAPVLRIGAKYSPVPFSKALEAAFIPGQEELESALRKLIAISTF